jgi:hypothetical protein
MALLGLGADLRLRDLRVRAARLAAGRRGSLGPRRPTPGARCRDPARSPGAGPVPPRRGRRGAVRRAVPAGRRHRRRHDDARRRARRPRARAHARPGRPDQLDRPHRGAGVRGARHRRARRVRPRAHAPRLRPAAGRDGRRRDRRAAHAGDGRPPARRVGVAAAAGRRAGPTAGRRGPRRARDAGELGARRVVPLARALGGGEPVRPAEPPGRRPGRHDAVRHRRRPCSAAAPWSPCSGC